MNFSIYLPEELAEKIIEIAQTLQRSRNSIIHEALEEWITKYASPNWPEGFFDFEAIEDLPDFEILRKEAKTPSEDPLA